MARRVTRSKNTPSEKNVVGLFVEAAKAIPEVQMVLVEDPSFDYPRIWTVISAPAFVFSYRRRVYDAQLVAQQQDKESLVDFRLINVQEIKGSVENVLPSGHRVLFQRKASV